ncbi:MAG: ATP-binding cassette domain-containing protein [Chloroflexi bacterium]|nr:ATP-binding cassette domain-containing protein [Chloroflexota bacterium]
MDALHAASATDIVESLPDGLNVVMAERGRTFSGGQRQRLGLARALLTEAEVLLLIEPTAAVDVHTEARIGARLPAARKGARPGASTVITTTSPLLLGHVDKVLYIVGGSVVAAGTHRELMESDPNYSATVLRDQE